MAAVVYHCYAKTPIGSAVAFTDVAVCCRVDASEIEIGTGRAGGGKNDGRGRRQWRVAGRRGQRRREGVQ